MGSGPRSIYFGPIPSRPQVFRHRPSVHAVVLDPAAASLTAGAALPLRLYSPRHYLLAHHQTARLSGLDIPLDCRITVSPAPPFDSPTAPRPPTKATVPGTLGVFPGGTRGSS